MKAILRTNGAFLLNGSSYFEGNAIMIGQDGYAGPICGPWYITEVNIYKSQNSYKPMLYILLYQISYLDFRLKYFVNN